MRPRCPCEGSGSPPFQPAVDLSVPVAVYQRSASWHDRFGAYLAEQTHVIWESGMPLLGREYGSDVRREAAALGDRAVRGALLFHGSDIRSPSRHAAAHAWSPYRDPSGPVRALESRRRRNAALAAEAGLPVFVSTPDQLEWLPDAELVSGRGRPRDMARGNDGGAAGPPVVVHAPSQKWLKGTDRIEPMLRRALG